MGAPAQPAAAPEQAVSSVVMGGQHAPAQPPPPPRAGTSGADAAAGAPSEPLALTPAERAAYEAIARGGAAAEAAGWALGEVPEMEPPPELCVARVAVAAGGARGGPGGGHY